MVTQLLKNSINYLLGFDPKTQQYASALEPFCLQISFISQEHPAHLQTQEQHYYITFCAQGLRTIERLEQAQADPTKSTMQIRATLATFLALVLHKNSRRAMEQGLIIEGDAEALGLLEAWLNDCHIDWAEMIATYLGDTAAHSIEKTLHRLLPKSRQKFEDLCAHIGEYAVEENLSPPRPLANHFLQAVDELRAGVERLEAKLA